MKNYSELKYTLKELNKEIYEAFRPRLSGINPEKFLPQKKKILTKGLHSEIPYLPIPKELEFNKQELYLVAEDKILSKLKTGLNKDFLKDYKYGFAFLFIVTSSYFFSKFWYLMMWAGFFHMTIYNMKSLNGIKERVYFNVIKKMYLTKDMKHVIIQYRYNDAFKKYDLNSFHLLDEKSYNQNIHGTVFPIAISSLNNGGVKFIPYNIFIYDREIFSAICRGVSIKVESEEDADRGGQRYIHYDINGNIKH